MIFFFNSIWCRPRFSKLDATNKRNRKKRHSGYDFKRNFKGEIISRLVVIDDFLVSLPSNPVCKYIQIWCSGLIHSLLILTLPCSKSVRRVPVAKYREVCTVRAERELSQRGQFVFNLHTSRSILALRRHINLIFACLSERGLNKFQWRRASSCVFPSMWISCKCGWQMRKMRGGPCVLAAGINPTPPWHVLNRCCFSSSDVVPPVNLSFLFD